MTGNDPMWRSRKAHSWGLLPKTSYSLPASYPPGCPFHVHCFHLGQVAWLPLVLLTLQRAAITQGEEQDEGANPGGKLAR